jgi:hypothetical protein
MPIVHSIYDLLKTQIAWINVPDGPGWHANVDGEECFLTMNNFPDEPLYTVIWRTLRLNIEDAPANWSIPMS